jgi:hypothetical protein
MKGNKIKKLILPCLKAFFGIFLTFVLGVFPLAGFTRASDNSDFTVATTTENVAEGANTQTADISESVANVSVGEDTQTNTIGTTTANLSEQKASRTISVGSLPTDGESIVIGSCVVGFVTTPGMTADQTDCTSDTATIDTNTNLTDVDRTPAEIATIISNLTNVGDSVHGDLSSSLHSNSVIFTTAGTETSATNINFNDYTGG